MARKSPRRWTERARQAEARRKPPKGRYHTDDELQKLARDFVANLVFCSDQCRKAEDVGMVFFPVALLDSKTIKQFQKDAVVHFYEYNSKSGPRGINGYPFFASFHALTRADYTLLREYEGKLRGAMRDAIPGGRP